MIYLKGELVFFECFYFGSYIYEFKIKSYHSHFCHFHFKLCDIIHIKRANHTSRWLFIIKTVGELPSLLSLLSVAVFLLDGYVSVEHVELDIKEMLELGKKAANTHKSTGSTTEMDNNRNRCVQEWGVAVSPRPVCLKLIFLFSGCRITCPCQTAVSTCPSACFSVCNSFCSSFMLMFSHRRQRGVDRRWRGSSLSSSSERRPSRVSVGALFPFAALRSSLRRCLLYRAHTRTLSLPDMGKKSTHTHAGSCRVLSLSLMKVCPICVCRNQRPQRKSPAQSQRPQCRQLQRPVSFFFPIFYHT